MSDTEPIKGFFGDPVVGAPKHYTCSFSCSLTTIEE